MDPARPTKGHRALAVDNAAPRDYIRGTKAWTFSGDEMAIRAEIPERTPIENVEMEYTRESESRKRRRGGFNRARLLDLSETSLELGAREAFRSGEKLSVSMHVKRIKDFMKIDCKVRKCTRVTILKQPAFAVILEFGKLAPDQAKNLAWARDQLVPKRQAAPLQRAEEKREVTPMPRVVEKAAPRRDEPAPEAKARVRRPVALLELIDGLDKFEVTDDLILAIIEAAEADMDVEVLYPKDAVGRLPDEEEPEAQETPAQALPVEGQARPMNVYRLARNTRLYFSEEGQPVGPAAELIYLSRLKTPANCFAVELGMDTMTQTGAPSFSRGSILLFSTTERVDSGDFGFIKTRSGDEFAQVFFDKNDEIRVHPLNSRYREHVVRRSEVRLLCKLIGHYEDWT